MFPIGVECPYIIPFDFQSDQLASGTTEGGGGSAVKELVVGPPFLHLSSPSLVPPCSTPPPELVQEAQRALAWEVAKKQKEEELRRTPLDQPSCALPHSATILSLDWATEEGVRAHRTYLLMVITPPIVNSLHPLVLIPCILGLPSSSGCSCCRRKLRG